MQEVVAGAGYLRRFLTLWQGYSVEIVLIIIGRGPPERHLSKLKSLTS
jgi:hypothetical protein